MAANRSAFPDHRRAGRSLCSSSVAATGRSQQQPPLWSAAKPCSGSCRSARSTILRAILASRTTVEEAAKLIAERPERRVDVAEMNDRIFINNSAIGLYPLMVVDRDLQRKRLGRSKRLAMIVASVRTLWRFGHRRLTLTINEEASPHRHAFAVRRQQRLSDRHRRSRAARKPRGRAAVRHGHAQEDTQRIDRGGVRALLRRSRPDDMVRLDGVERLQVSSPALNSRFHSTERSCAKRRRSITVSARRRCGSLRRHIPRISN